MSILLFADGGSRGNPGPAAFGYVIYQSQDTIYDINTADQNSWEILAQKGQYLDHTTNNQAEWQGLLQGLQEIVNLGLQTQPVQVFLDSELVIKQVLGIYKVKHPALKPLYQESADLKLKFTQISFQHIYRRFNSKADSLVNQALDQI